MVTRLKPSLRWSWRHLPSWQRFIFLLFLGFLILVVGSAIYGSRGEYARSAQLDKQLKQVQQTNASIQQQLVEAQGKLDAAKRSTDKALADQRQRLDDRGQAELNGVTRRQTRAAQQLEEARQTLINLGASQ